jgi:hypothetical protein
MGRALTAVGIALVLCIGGLGLVVYLSREEDRIAVDNLLAEDLSRAIATAEAERGGRVDLRRVANDFDWSEVLIVARGTPRRAITLELGYEWKGDVPFGVSETIIFLRASGAIARFADYRGEGQFEGFSQPIDRLDRREAVLRVRNLVITR